MMTGLRELRRFKPASLAQKVRRFSTARVADDAASGWSISAADAFGSTLLPDAVSQLLPGLGAPPAPSADALRAALAATPDDACAACLPEAPPPESAVLA